MDNVDDLTLLHRLYQCSRHIRTGRKYRVPNRPLPYREEASAEREGTR